MILCSSFFIGASILPVFPRPVLYVQTMDKMSSEMIARSNKNWGYSLSCLFPVSKFLNSTIFGNFYPLQKE